MPARELFNNLSFRRTQVIKQKLNRLFEIIPIIISIFVSQNRLKQRRGKVGEVCKFQVFMSIYINNITEIFWENLTHIRYL
ncbi:hypothetical protein EZS27_032288 [termite gut metagenome]|uniref:Uncharacterized protein n=1 Tax=termite gut metagenome TaxID=433724 RepID=A0A5J4Q9J0_9ZZZZ